MLLSIGEQIQGLLPLSRRGDDHRNRGDAGEFGTVRWVKGEYRKGR